VGGKPKEFSSYASGELSWHKPSSFAGAVVSEKGALFTYKANWDAPGRWGVEFLTKNLRIILQPLETIKIMKRGTVKVEDHIFSIDPIEAKYKPGLYKQVQELISNKKTFTPLLDEHCINTNTIYKKILLK